MSLDPTLIVTGEETHVGQVRSINQDACTQLVDPQGRSRLLLIADGMGGHQGGEVASQRTVETVEAAFRSEGDALLEDPGGWLKRTLEAANTRVFDEGQDQPSLTRMGTTAVAALFLRADELWLAHVGDSRIYRMRAGAYEQLTGDHSVVGELVRQGHLSKAAARIHPQRNEIQRAIGTQARVEVEVQSARVEPGDQYLLCSDGLTDMVEDDDIAEVLSRQEPAAAVHELVQMANLAGGNDNVTVQVAQLPAAAFDATAAVRAEPAGGGGEAPGGSGFPRAAWLALAFAGLAAGFYYFFAQSRS